MHDELPKDYETLAKSYRQLEAKLNEMEELIRFLQRGRFAAKSEKLVHPGMRSLFEDEQALATAEQEQVDERPVKSHTRKIKRKPLPAALPREEIFCDLPEEEKTCGCCQTPMVNSHQKISEKLHVKPAQFVVKKFILPVYTCKNCEQVKQAKMPHHPIPKCGVTTETLAHIAVSKYIDGLPLHRLEKMFARENIDLRRSKMARWLVSLSEKLAPLKMLLQEDLLAGDLIGMDETTIQVLKEKGRRPDQKSFMLAQARQGPPGQSITLFHYESSRSAATIARYLRGFKGSLLTDGLGVYISFSNARPELSHGGCMSHARRKFTDALKGKKGKSTLAKDAVALMGELFAIEAEIKGRPYDEVFAMRQQRSRPIMDSLRQLWIENIDSVPAKSLTGKALHYLKNQWALLSRFLADPVLPMHNNYLERQIRPFAVGRRAWLFADTPEGAHASSVFYSLLNTAKENGLNPFEYLKMVLAQIDQTNNLRTLLPYSNNLN